MINFPLPHMPLRGQRASNTEGPPETLCLSEGGGSEGRKEPPRRSLDHRVWSPPATLLRRSSALLRPSWGLS
eukprot:1503504-Pyramimonas_sp.AAC.1